MLLSQLHALTKPVDDLECALVRACLRLTSAVSSETEALLRTALSVARLQRIRDPRGRDVEVGTHLDSFRAEVVTLLGAAFGNGRVPAPEDLLAAARVLSGPTRRARELLAQRFANELPQETVDREIRQKRLVVVAGGGGGTGYVYLGAFELLQEWGLYPSLIVGTSMGSVLGLFRAAIGKMETSDMVAIVRGLTFGKLFRLESTESRYGLPAALRLYLRAGIGRYFTREDGTTPRLRDLPVPLIVVVCGVRGAGIRHPLEHYEGLLDLGTSFLAKPLALRHRITSTVRVLAEFVRDPAVTEAIYLGADADTRGFDALDAVGFSSAVPGVIHYDVLRDDPAVHELIRGVLDRHGVARFIDGGVADNVASGAAWRAVQEGAVGTRNAFVLALDGFAPKLTMPVWLPLQQFVAAAVERGKEFAHLYHPFRRTLSPVELLPDVRGVLRAIALGREGLAPEMPFIARMLAPLPPV